MYVLRAEVLLNAGQLRDGMDVNNLAQRSLAYLRRSPELLADLENVKALDDPRNPSRATWLRYWKTNPIAAWTQPRKGKQAWFALEQDRLVSRVPWPTDEDAAQALVAMTTELVDLRLAQYRRQKRNAAHATDAGQVSSFRVKVLTNGRDPILHLGNRKDRDMLPHGDTDVRLNNGTVWQFRFVKVACNVARPVGVQRNQLGDLLRRWFGPDAGKAGTDFHVEFRRSPDGWWAEPVGSNVIAFPARGRVVSFPSLRVAAGAVQAEGALQGDHVEAAEVRLPVGTSAEDLFAVRATGDSMDGGTTPIRDGDWMVMRWARGRGLGAVTGRVALVGVGDPADGRQFLVKRVVETEDGVVLRSENRDYPALQATEQTQVIALQKALFRPEDLAPAPGAILSGDGLADGFGVSTTPTAPWCRVDGHLFVFIAEPGVLVAPDRMRFEAAGHPPGETAFVLTKHDDDNWRYAGVARWSAKDAQWHLPAVDFETWRALGKGRSASRTLPDAWQERVWTVAQALAARESQWCEARGKRCRIVGRASRGGVRIDGGPDGFAERTVSVTDLAWVLMALGEVDGVVDEAAVNRLRYLDGTPKGSTRWIDTGWALVLAEAMRNS